MLAVRDKISPAKEKKNEALKKKDWDLEDKCFFQHCLAKNKNENASIVIRL